GDRAAGAQHPAEFGEGAVEVGDVVEDGVAEDEVEALVLEGQRLGLGGDGGDAADAERVGGGAELLQHAGGDVGRGEALDDPELDQVEREVAGAGADLQGVAEGLAPASAERLDQLQPHLLLAGVAEVDPPLGVVFVRRRVVVAGVDVLDVLGGGGGGGWHRRGTLRNTVQNSMEREYVQLNQPDGVPPLPLTGERTLPDVPEENYWYRRHLVVYEWIAARVAGLRVVDMACGEGYGSNVLAGSAASVIGVDANPEAYEHAR